MGGEDELTCGQRMSARWAGFRKFLWNGETREFLGRGGKSWGQITLFYLCFYACLAAFWACMLLVFMQTVDYSRPKWVSYISTPGLAVTPSLFEERIRYTPNNYNTFKGVVDKLDDVWKKLDPDNQDYAMVCDPTTPGNTTSQRFCKFNRENLGKWCTPENYYGYNTTEPCLFVNLNRVWGWIPEDPDADESDIPAGYEPGNIFISCEAYKGRNKDAINNTRIYPPQGLPFAYFPYLIGTNKNQQKMFISPYAAIRVSLVAEKAQGKDIKILCSAYTGNLSPRGGLFDTKVKSEFTVIFHLGKVQAPKDEM